ncbi:phosphodiesterase [Thiospirochaeta perfilievii]|uniref:Phosphoesterase n=1 Tax=Thiospirochaeta perfilievii TaxID=252967 RepID=A0A5C1Q9Y0_9SPIO|nr:phosphodiesterase [Thiospirochaeta perfilievii]QEN04943.1 phosphodiesterase [Thiospirochaeta perfilievii]
MDFFVISDIHGSSAALEKALNIYKKGNFESIIICGDILYHGARNPLPEGYNPRGVIDLLNEVKGEIIAIRGNCESEVDQMVLDFPITGDYSYLYNGSRKIFITHGHKYSKESLPPLKDGSIFLYGHTHIPDGSCLDGIYSLNPGSITLPKGDFPASYAILTSTKWEVRNLMDSSLILSCIFN